MKPVITLYMLFSGLIGYAQNVGIGTQNPQARLHVADSSVVFSANGLSLANPGLPPIFVESRRMMWYADKGAFRAGYAFNELEDMNIGNYSTAFGFSAIGAGVASFAAGVNVKALGYISMAMGDNSQAIGDLSLAFGYKNRSTGVTSVAIGHGVVARAYQSIVLGSYNDSIISGSTNTNSGSDPLFIIGNGISDNSRSNALLIRKNGNVGIGTNAPNAKLHIENGSIIAETAGFANEIPLVPPKSGAGRRMMWYADKAAFRVGYVAGTQWDQANIGDYSLASGYNTQADGHVSVALGNSVRASGSSSFAAGRNVAANGDGSFIFGDNDPNGKGLRTSQSANLFWARFNGGYYLVSNDAGNDIGVRVLAGGNSWTTISDKNLKENFEPVDGEALLEKLADIPQYTWNYKGQNPSTFRHYGPMAQDFYKAFGKDEYGTIGCDTLINQHDFIGVNMVAIQALEKRTDELKKELLETRREMALLAEQNSKLLALIQQ